MNFRMHAFELIYLVIALVWTFCSTKASGQEVGDKIMNKVFKMANGELKKVYSDPYLLTEIRDIKSTLRITESTVPVWSDHPDVDLSQVSFDVEVRYNKIVDPKIGEIASFREVLRCVLSKYRSFKWNRLTLSRNDCQDCGEQSLVELKRAVNSRYVVP